MTVTTDTFPEPQVSWKVYLDAMLDERAKAVEAALSAARRAIDESKESAEHRFISIDQLRQDLIAVSDRAMGRAECEQEFLVIREQLGQLAELKANEVLQLERVSALRRETEALRSNSDKAIEKSETATERRFESVNEFRAQLSDQAGRFMPREVAEAQVTELRNQLTALTARVDVTAGSSAGANKTVGYVLAVATLIISVIVFLATRA